MQHFSRHAVPALVLLIAAAGCGGSGAPGAVVTGQTVLVSDPVEDGFTVQMPRGWRNLAYTARTYDITRSVLNSTSPDGSTVLFIGDPSSPLYFEPTFEAINVTKEQAKVNPLIRISEFQAARVYLPDYAKRKFGKLEGFAIVSTEDDPEVQKLAEEKIKEQGFESPVTAAVLRFTFTDGGKPMKSMLIASTSQYKSVWSIGVGGISTPGDPADYRQMLLSWIRTFKIKPEWTAKQKALHEQRMEEIRQAGRNSQARLQQMASSHQARMDAIRAAGDASMKSYYERDAASDRTQRNFLNYINDETTVATTDGKQHQVATGYQRYFMHKRTGAYVGGDAHTNLDSLRKMGLNPDDYTEVQIKK